MHQIRYMIRTLAPVLITEISGDTNMVSTLDYIPGTVMNGIFARKYIEHNNLHSEAHRDEFFQNCFLNSGVCFTNAYIDMQNTIKKSDAYYPTPISIQEAKKAADTDDNKIFDLIKCKNVNSATKSIGKYCKIDGDGMVVINASKSINFHHSRSDRLKGCSDDGTIYNYEAINPWQEFSGRIIGKKENLDTLMVLFAKSNEIDINIGRSKNIQYGQARLRLISESSEMFDNEISTFDPARLNSIFSLTFLSSAIIYNANGFPTASLSDFRSYLADSIGISEKNIHINKVFKKSETVEQFNSKWVLKRLSETAIKAGSCFEICIEGWNEKIKESLIELQRMGIGERTGEGFGRFALNLQESEHYVLKKTPPVIEKPCDSVPDITAQIIKNVTIKSLLDHAEFHALADCKGFCEKKDQIPSNSLLGKLELMLKDSNDMRDFITKIDKLPDMTAKKLELCKNTHIKKDLFSFIKGGYLLDMNMILDTQLKECCKLINFEPEKDNVLNVKIQKNYWFIFLRSMRKEKKKGGN